MQNTAEKDLEQHHVDHLLLLIGRNPLPNGVAAWALAAPGGRIYLIHTGPGGTQSVQERLKPWIEEVLRNHRGSPICIPKEIDSSKPHEIYSAVQSCLNEVKPGQTIGLNYTGGTKAMAVHAYHALKQARPDSQFSYLDATTLELRFDPTDPTQPGGAPPSSLENYPALCLEDLIRLHGWKYWPNTVPMKGVPMPQTVAKLGQVFGTPKSTSANGVRAWRTWKSKFRDGRPGSISLKDLESDRRTPADLVQAMRRDLGSCLCSDETFDIEQTARHLGFNKAKDFIRYLDGSWLEGLVLEALNQLHLDYKVQDACMNVELMPDKGKQFKFEFDVVGLRGYQLFAFSCSAISEQDEDGWYRMKQKLFEAYIRARQFGGDEARVALVCATTNTVGLQRHLQRELDLEKNTRRIRVFGCNDLTKLPQKIEKWIRQQA